MIPFWCVSSNEQNIPNNRDRLQLIHTPRVVQVRVHGQKQVCTNIWWDLEVTSEVSYHVQRYCFSSACPRRQWRTLSPPSVTLEKQNRYFVVVACTDVAMQWLGDRPINNSVMQWTGKHIPTATNMHATIELLLEMVFSTRSMQRGCKEDNWGYPVSWELSSAREAEKRWHYNWKL
jgi:hypothetical protein